MYWSCKWELFIVDGHILDPSLCWLEDNYMNSQVTLRSAALYGRNTWNLSHADHKGVLQNFIYLLMQKKKKKELSRFLRIV